MELVSSNASTKRARLIIFLTTMMIKVYTSVRSESSRYNSIMCGNMKVVFGFSLILLLIQVLCCAPTNQDEILQDLTTLRRHQEDDIHVRMAETLQLAESARKHMMSVDNCSKVRESFREIVSYLTEDAGNSLAKTNHGICKKLCLKLLKYTDPAMSECSHYHDSHLDTDDPEFRPETEIEPMKLADDADCNLAEEKNQAMKELAVVESDYIDSMTESRLVAEKSIEAIYNALAVFKKADVELRGDQEYPKTPIETARIINIARELRNKLDCSSNA